MPDDFRLEFGDADEWREKRQAAAAERAKSRAKWDEDDGIDYEVDPERPPPVDLPPDEPAEDINETWYRNYDQEFGLRRFSIAEMMGVTTMVAVSLTVVRWLPMKISAGMLGVAVIIGLVILADDSPKPRMFHLGFWTLLIVYLCVAIFAAAWS